MLLGHLVLEVDMRGLLIDRDQVPGVLNELAQRHAANFFPANPREVEQSLADLLQALGHSAHPGRSRAASPRTRAAPRAACSAHARRSRSAVRDSPTGPALPSARAPARGHPPASVAPVLSRYAIA